MPPLVPCLSRLARLNRRLRPNRPRKPRRRLPPRPGHLFHPRTRPNPAPATLIQNATILTGTGTRIDGGDVLIENGRITAVGQSLSAPAGAQVIDANGRWVTPGLIDVHSHMGAYASPGVDAQNDGNESTEPVTANVWVEHSVWPQDPGFESAIHGGVTSLQILPGSANLIGGRGVTLKNVPATTYQSMKFPGAPQGLKMACGENPKRVYGDDDQFPKTRMGNVAGYRQAFADAKDYMEDWKEYDAKLAQYERRKLGRRGRAPAPAAETRPGARDARGGDARQHPRSQPLLPRGRNGDHARYRAGIRLPDLDLPSRRRSLQAGRPARRGGRVRRTVGRLVGFQDGSLRRHPGKPRDRRPPRRAVAPSCTPTPKRASSA